jgi:hypothetical protein
MSNAITPADLRTLAATCAPGQAGRQSAFAAFAGWDKSHVTRLKQLGQLVLDDAGRVLFAASLQRIADHADPARDAQRDVAAARRATAPQTAPAVPPPAGDRDPDAPEDPDDDPDAPKYAASRATKEYWAAQTAKVEYERLVGELVRKADVDKAVADAAIQFRQAIDNQPHRLADRLVGKDLEQIRALLRDDGQHMLGELSRGFAKRLQHSRESA